MTKFACNQEIVTRARHNLTQDLWDYLTGGAESETTMRRNRYALDSYAFIPRILRDVTHIDTSTTFLGHPLRIPVMLAPIGSLQALHAEGAAGSIKAAAAFGTIPMISSITEPSLEDSAAAADSAKILQLYVRGDWDWVKAVLTRAKNAGYVAVALTVDSAYYGIRERQLMNGWLPPSVQVQKNRHHQAAITWDLLARIKEFWAAPLILKGVAAPDDAALAVAHGVDAIYISNHGGRQLDHCLGALDTLAWIAPTVRGKTKLLVDGNILRGTDVIKAVALGADAVLIGRLQGWSLAAGGAGALVDCLEILEKEITNALALLGVTAFDQLNGDYIRKTEVVGPTHAFSTFHHLRDTLA